MEDIRKHREEIDALRSEFLNGLSNLFEKPMHFEQSIWTKADEDPEKPVPDRNCIQLNIDWD